MRKYTLFTNLSCGALPLSFLLGVALVFLSQSYAQDGFVLEDIARGKMDGMVDNPFSPPPATPAKPITDPARLIGSESYQARKLRELKEAYAAMEKASGQPGQSYGDPGSKDQARIFEERAARQQALKQNLQGELPTGRKAATAKAYSPDDLNNLLKKLDNPNIKALDKKRIAAIATYHSDILRSGILNGDIDPRASYMQAYLEQKALLNVDAIALAGQKYRNRYGHVPADPIIPFAQNNFRSDLDNISGQGTSGKRMESLIDEAFDEIIQDHTGRKMTAAERSMIDVNNLAWDMSQEGAFEKFHNAEKYIQPETGLVNQDKLITDAKAGKLKGYRFTENGRLVEMSREATVKAIEGLRVETGLKIPGLDPRIGTSASISDFVRMAHKHQLKSGPFITRNEVGIFMRNQKYSARSFDKYGKILGSDARLSQEMAEFLEYSRRISEQSSAYGVAQVLEQEFGTRIIKGTEIDYKALNNAVLKHQTMQLANVLPAMLNEVTSSEAYKIAAWLKSATAADRRLLRKQMALTYAPMDENTLKRITSGLDNVDIDAADREFLKSIINNDTRQIRGHADILKISAEDLVKFYDPTTGAIYHGKTQELMEMMKNKNLSWRALDDSLAHKRGGDRFRKFLREKTIQSMDLKYMLTTKPGLKQTGIAFASSGLLFAAVAHAYSQGMRTGDEVEAYKQVFKVCFSMIPYVAAGLRFSEMEWREAAKEFFIDYMPPLALAYLAGVAMQITSDFTRDVFEESILDDIAAKVLTNLSDDDFELSDVEGYYRLKERGQLLEALDEFAPALGGGLSNLSAIIEPEIDKIMDRHPEVQTNRAALEMVRYLYNERIDIYLNIFEVKYKPMFNLTQLKAKVYQQDISAFNDAPIRERAAARILFDNLRIRKEIYYDVLGEFINRVEDLYNAEKPPGVDDIEKIIESARARLKDIYENPPEEIKQSPWATDKLTENHDEWLHFLKSEYDPYRPETKTPVEVQRDMQGVIDNFRKYIDKLVMGVDLYEEIRYLDLSAHVYGGDNALETDDDFNVVLLGDYLRVGISARVRPSRRNLKWTVFYYVYRGNEKWDLAGSVSLDPSQFNPRNDGLWPIDAPERSTFLEFDSHDSLKYFPNETHPNAIVPVLAFGNWKQDPVSEFGATALFSVLKNPIEYAEYFEADRAAFAGKKAVFYMARPEIYIDAPKYVYRNDKAEIKLALRVPKYARGDRPEVKIDIEPLGEGWDAKPSPGSHAPVSTDSYDPPGKPSVSRLEITPFYNKEKRLKMGLDGSDFEITVKARLRRLTDAAQPPPYSFSFKYIDEDNPEIKVVEEDEKKPGGTIKSSGEKDKGPPVNPLLARMQELEAQAAALKGESTRAAGNVQTLLSEFIKTSKEFYAERDVFDKKIRIISDEQFAKEDHGVSDSSYSRNIDIWSKRIAEINNQIESSTLIVCEAYEKIKATDEIKKVDSIFANMDANDRRVQGLYEEFSRLKENMLNALARIEASDDQSTASISDQDSLWQAYNKMKRVYERQASVVGKVNNNMLVLYDNRPKALDYSSQAAGILEKGKKEKDKKLKKKLKKLFDKIKKYEESVSKDFDANKYVYSQISMVLAANEDSIKDTESMIKSLAGGTDFIENIAVAKEARASYEAAMLFNNKIRAANENNKICAAGVDKLYAQKNSPEARVARADCSKYPGTSAKWFENTNEVKCSCGLDKVWSVKLKGCVKEQEALLASADCSGYPGSEPDWNLQDQKYYCDCLGNKEWDVDQTACQVKKSIQVAEADCSSGGLYDEAYWDYRLNKVQCRCEQGYGRGQSGKCERDQYASTRERERDDDDEPRDEYKEKFIDDVMKGKDPFGDGKTPSGNGYKKTGNEAYDTVMGQIFADPGSGIDLPCEGENLGMGGCDDGQTQPGRDDRSTRDTSVSGQTASRSKEKRPYTGGCPAADGVRLVEGPVESYAFTNMIWCTYRECDHNGCGGAKVTVTVHYHVNPNASFSRTALSGKKRTVVSNHKYAYVEWSDNWNRGTIKFGENFWTRISQDLLRRVEPYAAP